MTESERNDAVAAAAIRSSATDAGDRARAVVLRIAESLLGIAARLEGRRDRIWLLAADRGPHEVRGVFDPCQLARDGVRARDNALVHRRGPGSGAAA